MAEIVLIHGIGQEGEEPEQLLGYWLQALNLGLSAIGEAKLAGRLTVSNVRMAFYGHLFVKPGAQGVDDLLASRETGALAEQLAATWVARAASRATNEGIREDGQSALAETTPAAGGEAQGVMRPVRSAVNSLARIRYFAIPTFAAAQRVANHALEQVMLYVTNTDRTRELALAEVDKIFTDDAKIVIGHSLGSVVAYEACHRRGGPVPLLVTLGSPLGLETIVYPRTVPQPPSFPDKVRLWVNAADLDDIVAADPNLGDVFRAPTESTLLDHAVDNGRHPHDAVEYLKQPVVAYAVALTLLRAAA